MNFKKTCLAALLSIAALLQSAPTLAQSCTAISTVPATISVPGKYCLSRHLKYEGAVPSSFILDIAITIDSHDVVLDFNGYTLLGGGYASINDRSIGVYASEKRNVTVRNGAVRSFGTGILLAGGTGSGVAPLVERMVVDGIRTNGIVIGGQGATVRANRVSNCGATGINVQGAGARIVDNAVYKITSGIYRSIGINASGSGSVVQNNSVAHVLSSQGWPAAIQTGSHVLIKDNVLYNPQTAGSTAIYARYPTVGVTVDNNTAAGFTTGIDFGENNTASRYKNNTVNGALSAAYIGGTNGGGNN